MSDTKNPCDEPHKIALYRDIGSGSNWTHVSRFYEGSGQLDDAKCHGDSVRISDPAEVKFTALSNKEAISNAISMLDAKEQKIMADAEMALRAIREQKQSLLAITYQPAEVV